jgi:membrane-associated phospholipid phosphatase
MEEALIKIDDAVTGWVQKWELPMFLETAICPGGALCGWQGTVGVIIPSVWYVYGKQGLYYHLVTTALAQIVSRLAKQVIQRKRPTVPTPTPYRYWKFFYKHLLDVAHAPDNKDGASFPSGDTMSGGTLGGCLSIIHNSWWPLLIPVWVGIGRQFFFCHWFLDTVGGGLLGVTSAYLVDRVFFNSYKDIRTQQLYVIIVVFLALMLLSTRIANFLRQTILNKMRKKRNKD